jgi:hypothetical protein
MGIGSLLKKIISIEIQIRPFRVPQCKIEWQTEKKSINENPQKFVMWTLSQER